MFVLSPIVGKIPRVTSEYGMRTDPATKLQKMHAGIDLVPAGDLCAIADGEVIDVRSNVTWSYADTKSLKGVSTSLWSGNYVTIKHGNGFQTRYLHMKSVKVKVGDKVTKGQIIGYMGRTGYSTGVHLHFEIKWNGATQNPRPFLEGSRIMNTNPNTYVVKAGDTLSKIAKAFSTTVEELVRLNDIRDKNIINIGDVLILKEDPTTEFRNKIAELEHELVNKTNIIANLSTTIDGLKSTLEARTAECLEDSNKLSAEHAVEMSKFKAVLTFAEDKKITLRVNGRKGQMLYIKED